MRRMQKHPLLIWLLTCPFVSAIHSPEWREASVALLCSGAPARTESFLRSRTAELQLDSQNSSSHFIQQLGIFPSKDASTYSVLGHECQCTRVAHSSLPFAPAPQHEPQTDGHTRVQRSSSGIGYQKDQDKQCEYDVYGNPSQLSEVLEAKMVPVEESAMLVETTGLEATVSGVSISQATPQKKQHVKHTKTAHDRCNYWQQTVDSCGSVKICNFNKRALAACQGSKPPRTSRHFSQNTGAPPGNRNVTVNIPSKVSGDSSQGMMAESTARLKFLTSYFFLWLSSFTLLQYLLGHGLASMTNGEVARMDDGDKTHQNLLGNEKSG